MTSDKNKIYKNDSPKKAYHRAWYWKNKDRILENNRIKRELNETNKNSNLDDSSERFESDSSLLNSEDSNSSFDSCPIFNEDYFLINELFNYDSNFLNN